MRIPAAIKKGWEHRFPALSGKWTHWKITGDGGMLGIVEGDNLTHALEVVEANYGRFASIKAFRVTVDENFQLCEEENHSTEISRFDYDEKTRRASEDRNKKK